MRLAFILLTTTACGRVFGLDRPERAPDAEVAQEIDAATIDATPDSPMLDAMWNTIVFNDGDTVDTYIDSGSPNGDFSTDGQVRWKTDSRYGLVTFGPVFGVGLIPVGAPIISARLQLKIEQNNCTSSMYEVAIDWSGATTYNTFGASPGIDAADLGPIVVSDVPTTSSVVVLDVTSSLSAWSAAPATMHGWIFIAAGAGGDCTVRSSEDGVANSRPQLVVTYASD